MSDFIPLSVPNIAGNEWSYVKDCLDTGWVSSAGKYVEKFEQEIAKYTGAKFAVACTNGTAALHVSLRLAGVKEGDEVIVPTVTFIAPVNAARYLNAFPVFMDCDEFYNIDSEKTVRFIEKETVYRDGGTFNRHTGRRIAAIILVHVFGNAAWLDDIVPVCSERNIKVVEDATESLGSRYLEGKFQKKHTGTLGELGCLSFNGNKIITTGGGGMILTDDAKLASKAKYLTTQAKDDEVTYVHHDVGYNYRLTNIQAAMGLAQLENLQRYLDVKKKNYSSYHSAISTIPGLHLSGVPRYADNNMWMYALRIDDSVYRRDRDALMAHLNKRGIQTRPVWHLNHLQKPYANCESYSIERAVHLHKTTLNIPCSVGLSNSQIDEVVRCLRDE